MAKVYIKYQFVTNQSNPLDKIVTTKPLKNILLWQQSDQVTPNYTTYKILNHTHWGRIEKNEGDITNRFSHGLVLITKWSEMLCQIENEKK